MAIGFVLCRYEVTELPTKGSLEFLCDGKEVYSVGDCGTDSLDDDMVEPQVYYKYTPRSDAEGADAFKFSMRVTGQSNLQSSNGSIALNVLKVNQPPVSYSGEISADLQYNVEPFSTAGVSPIRLNATDSDADELVALIDLRSIWSGAGEIFVPVSPEASLTRPIHELENRVDDVPWAQVCLLLTTMLCLI